MSGQSRPSGEWDAPAYHRLSQPQVEWGERVLRRLPLRGDETVMDAGCGTGRLTARLLEHLPRGRVIAVDRSGNMLRLAADYLTPRFGERVTLLQADLESLEMVEAVDVIFSTATFHWVRDHPNLFRRLYRVLKPGGRLVAQCGGGPNLERLFQRTSALLASAPYTPYFAGWPGPWELPDDITTAKRLRDAGFVEVETGLEPAPAVLGSAEEYREFLSAVIFRAHLERIPDGALRARFLDALTDKAAGDVPPFSLDYWRLNLQGTRPNQHRTVTAPSTRRSQ